MHHMALTAVYGKKFVLEQDVRPVSERGSNKTDAMKEHIACRWKKRKEDWKRHKQKKRVLFFGPGTFGHDRRGPCSRNALLRSLVFLPLPFLCRSTTRRSVAVVAVLCYRSWTVRVYFDAPKGQAGREPLHCADNGPRLERSFQHRRLSQIYDIH